MAIGKAARLNARRKQGPSFFEKQRGPNTGAWENTHHAIQRPSQSAMWSRGYRTGQQNVQGDRNPRGEY